MVRGMLPQIGWGVSDFEGYIPSILGYQLAISQIPIMFQQMSLLFQAIPLDGVLVQNGPKEIEKLIKANEQRMREWSMMNPKAMANCAGNISHSETSLEIPNELQPGSMYKGRFW